MSKIKLKICGMKYANNILEIIPYQPDYLGFIFYEKSLRNYTDEEIIEIPETTKKVGVFVNESYDEIITKINKYQLNCVQLHGNETPEFCEKIKNNNNIEVIKAFSISESFDFKFLKPYKKSVDYFLFDTKGKLPGGNGIKFDWSLLDKYTLKVPFFLSGGIGLTNISSIKTFLQTGISKYCYAIDVNSRFENKPGVKNASKIKRLYKKLYENKI